MESSSLSRVPHEGITAKEEHGVIQERRQGIWLLNGDLILFVVAFSSDVMYDDGEALLAERTDCLPIGPLLQAGETEAVEA